MNHETKESVVYTPATISVTRSLKVYNGPLDGEEDWTVEPGYDRVLLWYWSDDGKHQYSASYRVAWRWSHRNGDEGFVLVWDP